MYKKILKAMGSAGGYQQRQPGIIHTLRYTCSCTYMGLFMVSCDNGFLPCDNGFRKPLSHGRKPLSHGRKPLSHGTKTM